MLPTQICPALSLDNPQSIRAYFEKVRELAQSGNPFPVSLDEIWPLVYSEKSKAVRALRQTFYEDVDFQSFAQNGKREIGATVTHVYQLSVACMEFFIARKVREVFDVYRKVFHHVVGTAVHVPQAGVIAKLEKLEHTLALMKKESARQFKVRKEQFWYNARVRQENRQKTAKERERQELFDLLQQYVKIESFSTPLSILNDIVLSARIHYCVDLKVSTRYVGEHLFDVAIREGRGRMVQEIIKTHLQFSAKLK